MNVEAKANATGCLVQDLPESAYASALLLIASVVQRARILALIARWLWRWRARWWITLDR